MRVASARLVTFTQRAVAAIRYAVEALDRPVRIVVQSELVANESLPSLSEDPRAAAGLRSPLVMEENVRLSLCCRGHDGRLSMSVRSLTTISAPCARNASA